MSRKVIPLLQQELTSIISPMRSYTYLQQRKRQRSRQGLSAGISFCVMACDSCKVQKWMRIRFALCQGVAMVSCFIHLRSWPKIIHIITKKITQLRNRKKGTLKNLPLESFFQNQEKIFLFLFWLLCRLFIWPWGLQKWLHNSLDTILFVLQIYPKCISVSKIRP